MCGVQLKINVNDLFSYAFWRSMDGSVAHDIWNCVSNNFLQTFVSHSGCQFFL
jgi:hypothetical protein